MNILIVGDIHGLWGTLNVLINRKRPDLVLQCGDFGHFPHLVELARGRDEGGMFLRPTYPQDTAECVKLRIGQDQRVELRFCDGNHEDHDDLRNLAKGKREAVEMAPGLFYQPRGSTLTLPDGRVVLFMGGAKSVDWQLRKEGRDWFPREQVTAEDVADLPDKVDIVISHTAPRRFPICKFEGGAKLDDVRMGLDIDPDPSREFLDQVLDRCQPSRWFFGHFHRFRTGTKSGCTWTALGSSHKPTLGPWWMWLDGTPRPETAAERKEREQLEQARKMLRSCLL
ncbi:MAG: metallophosphoesterase [Desulfovibrionaceae bacterium]